MVIMEPSADDYIDVGFVHFLGITAVVNLQKLLHLVELIQGHGGRFVVLYFF